MDAPALEAGPDRPPVGHYTYAVAGDHWSWSDAVYALHGYEPYSVPASTELLLRHLHPEDRARALDSLEAAVRDGQPFSCGYRIVDCAGRVRSVLAVGCGVGDPAGRVRQLVGSFADLSGVERRATASAVEARLLRRAEERAGQAAAMGELTHSLG